MKQRIKLWLFPEYDVLAERTKGVAGILQIQHERLEAIEAQADSSTKVNGILIDRVQDLEDVIGELDEINKNLLQRVHNLETKYTEVKDFKPIPTGHASWRAHKQSLERGANARMSSRTESTNS